MAKTKLELDDFFDGAEGESDVRCSTPDPTRYHSPYSQTTESDQQPLGSHVPMVKGIRGAIIPRATDGGISQGWDPHNPPTRVVIIDPHVPGCGVAVDHSKLTRESIDAALARANTIDTGKLRKFAAQRLRATTAYQLLGGRDVIQEPDEELDALTEKEAAQSEEQPTGHKPAPRPPITVVQTSAMSPVPMTKPASAPAAGSTRSLMSSFTRPKPGPTVVTGSEMSQAAAVAQGQPVQPPEIHVLFELGEGLQHEAYYHRVLQEGASLVLIFDRRFKGPTFFPTNVEKEVAVLVEGNSVVHRCLSTGIRFDDRDCTYCVLLITDSRGLEQPNNGSD